MTNFRSEMVLILGAIIAVLTIPTLLVNAAEPETDWQGKTAGEQKVLTIKEIEYAFRWCPPGTFEMGSPRSETDRDENESQHQVTLTKGFWMLETEVTQGMWESEMDNNPSNIKGIKLPVEQVSWDDAQDYIKKLNALGVAPRGYKFSLPTEAQWEYACRAGTTTQFHFGDQLKEKQVNFGSSQTTVVGSYPANAWGLYDMHGNVFEWCSDWYGDYPSSSVTDPVGPSTGSLCVHRGGSWYGSVESCRSARRLRYAPSNRSSCLGLRLSLVSE
ncbi:MAG: formylglycine-generating enzyme family protein [Thermoguttaceae bacterium]